MQRRRGSPRMDHTHLNQFIDQPARPASRGYGYTHQPRSPMAAVAQKTLEKYPPHANSKPDRFRKSTRVMETWNQGTQWHSAEYRHPRIDKIDRTLEDARLKPREGDVYAMSKLKCRGGNEEVGSLTYKRPHFSVNHAYYPEISVKATDLPRDISEQLSQGKLMSPAMRRKAMKAEREIELARKELKRRQFEVDRRVGHMQKHHKEGVYGLDKPEFNDSQIYHDQQNMMTSTFKNKSMRTIARANNIVKHVPKYTFKGDVPMSHGGLSAKTDHDEVALRERALVQRRSHNGPRLDTHERVFGRDPPKDQSERKRRLRSLTTRGRTFDPVFHKQIDVAPPTHKNQMRTFHHLNQCQSDDLPDIYNHSK
mmetsp:Transcript_15241/g.30888  ORF Transcript_15241/g.30888 Transcript_15241/m.30888 type:complete len:367 (-) Transcript_15241:400-1500(-)